MYKVYSRAARVLVWLGQEEDDSAAAIEYIRSLEYSLPTISQLMEARGVIPLPPGLDDAQLLQAIWQLNMRPWYFRLWVFQEVVLAGDFDIICGQSRVSGKHLYAIRLEHEEWQLLQAGCKRPWRQN